MVILLKRIFTAKNIIYKVAALTFQDHAIGVTSIVMLHSLKKKEAVVDYMAETHKGTDDQVDDWFEVAREKVLCSIHLAKEISHKRNAEENQKAPLFLMGLD